MKKQIKKLIALLIVLCMSSAYMPMTIKADTTDRVLTSEDIPDENLYNSMLASTGDGDEELRLSEVESLTDLYIRDVISDFTGLELVTNHILVRFDCPISLEEEGISQEELKCMLEMLKEYDCVNQLSIYGISVNEEIYEVITDMSLAYLSVDLDGTNGYGYVALDESTEKPLNESLCHLTLSFSDGNGEFSLENLESYVNLISLNLNSGYYADLDKVSQFQELTGITLRGSYVDKNIDLSQNTNLTYVYIENYDYRDEKLEVILGDKEDIIKLRGVTLSEIPTNCSSLEIEDSDLSSMVLDFSEFENLEYLTISNCGISDISGLENCTKLVALVLDSNELTKIPSLPETDLAVLSLYNNKLSKEELLANAPEKFTSSAIWVAETLRINLTAINGQSFNGIYTELNSEFFSEIIDNFDENSGTVYSWFSTNSNEVIIEKEIIEKAANMLNTTIIFIFDYYDELGNIATAEVDLRNVYEELNSDCVIDFGFGKNEDAVSVWNTENVYCNLHKQYTNSEIIDGVSYYLYGGNSYNVYTYTDSMEPYKYVGIIENMLWNNLFSEDVDYYFIPSGADPNYVVTPEIGVTSGQESLYDYDLSSTLDYKTVFGMEDYSTLIISGDIFQVINKDCWNLLIDKKITLKIWASGSGVYLDGIVTISWENMTRVSGDVIIRCDFAPYDLYSDDGLLKTTSVSIYSYEDMQNPADSADVQLYVGDIAKNGETVCEVEEFDYISADKQLKHGYEILGSYIVASGMISLTLNNEDVVLLRNIKNIDSCNKLPFPTDVTYYEAGDEMVSVTKNHVDNIDLRDCADGFTISCDFIKSELYGGTFWGIDDRFGDASEYVYLFCETGYFYLTVATSEEYSMMCCPIPGGFLNIGEKYQLDVVVENIDNVLYATLYFEGTILGTMNVMEGTLEYVAEPYIVQNTATSGNATSGNALEGASIYGGGLDEFDITLMNTIYCVEDSVNFNFCKNDVFSNISITAYAGNIFAEDTEDTKDIENTEDTEGAEDIENTEGTEGAEDSGNTDESADTNTRYEEPEFVEDEEIVDSSETSDVLIEDIKESEDKTIEVVSKDSYTIDKDVFDEMKKADKNIVCGIVNEDNELMYSWSFAAKHIENPDMDIDMDIEVNEYNSKVDNKLKDKDALYINFKHHGKLPGPATVKVYVGEKYKKDEKIHLYYYDEENDKMLRVGAEALRVKEGGYIEFTITHCSTYFVLDEAKAALLNAEEQLELDKDSFSNVNFNIIEQSMADVEAGASSDNGIIVNVAMTVMCSALLLGIAMFGTTKRKRIIAINK